MADQNYIEDLKTEIINAINSQREEARVDLDKDLEALRKQFEKKRFELQDKYINKFRKYNYHENCIQMGDFFCLADLTNALSQMISNAEGEKYVSHKTEILDEEGKVVNTIVTFAKASDVDKVDEKIRYVYSMNPESVKGADSSYVYLCEYDDSNLNFKPYLYGNGEIVNSDIMVTFNPYNEFLDDRHVLANINDPRFEYVNSFMNIATQTKLLYGFERSDDFAQMAIVHGTGIYKKRKSSDRKGRIKSVFNKK